jgi:hypothetical protein
MSNDVSKTLWFNAEKVVSTQSSLKPLISNFCLEGKSDFKLFMDLRRSCQPYLAHPVLTEAKIAPTIDTPLTDCENKLELLTYPKLVAPPHVLVLWWTPAHLQQP